MGGFSINIDLATKENNFFRKVIHTANHSQLVLMALSPSEEIGVETHKENDQFFRFELGAGKVIVNGEEFIVGDGDIVIVPSGAEHNVINTSKTDYLKFYTLYSPSHHPDGTIHKTKDEAEAAEH
jgi:mannose-6-phosphate isomerase-like protein (cupin superfamily)